MTYKNKMREIGKGYGVLVPKVILNTIGGKVEDFITLYLSTPHGSVMKLSKIKKVGGSQGFLISKDEKFILGAEVGTVIEINIKVANEWV